MIIQESLSALLTKARIRDTKAGALVLVVLILSVSVSSVFELNEEEEVGASVVGESVNVRRRKSVNEERTSLIKINKRERKRERESGVVGLCLGVSLTRSPLLYMCGRFRLREEWGKDNLMRTL